MCQALVLSSNNIATNWVSKTTPPPKKKTESLSCWNGQRAWAEEESGGENNFNKGGGTGEQANVLHKMEVISTLFKWFKLINYKTKRR